MSDLTQAVRSAADLNSTKYASLSTAVEIDAELNLEEKSTLNMALEESNARLSALDQATTKDNVNRGGWGTLDAFGEIVNAVTGSAQGLNDEENIDPPQNPTSYAFFWYAPHLERVQWNGVGSDVMTRNLGEVLGVFGTFTLGNPSAPAEPYTSSANIEHLYQLEKWVSTLEPPIWNESVFGDIDIDLAAQGSMLFGQLCSRCHVVKDDQGRFPMTEPNSLGHSFIKVVRPTNVCKLNRAES